MNKDYERERRIALRLFSEPCIGKRDVYHDGNCQHCALRGAGGDNECIDNGYPEPNYAGWARLYVQAGKTIPARFSQAFKAEKASSNELYAEALADDIAHYGVTIEQV